MDKVVLSDRICALTLQVREEGVSILRLLQESKQACDNGIKRA